MIKWKKDNATFFEVTICFILYLFFAPIIYALVIVFTLYNVGTIIEMMHLTPTLHSLFSWIPFVCP